MFVVRAAKHVHVSASPRTENQVKRGARPWHSVPPGPEPKQSRNLTIEGVLAVSESRATTGCYEIAVTCCEEMMMLSRELNLCVVIWFFENDHIYEWKKYQDSIYGEKWNIENLFWTVSIVETNTTRSHARTHERARTHTHARTHARKHERTHARTHARTNARTNARTHAHTQTHTMHDYPTLLDGHFLAVM